MVPLILEVPPWVPVRSRFALTVTASPSPSDLGQTVTFKAVVMRICSAV